MEQLRDEFNGGFNRIIINCLISNQFYVMKTSMLQFKKSTLSRSEMREVIGGKWDYIYTCRCDGVTYTGSGDINSYREDAQFYCAGRGPVSCEFQENPS